jgi:hypothetical protein
LIQLIQLIQLRCHPLGLENDVETLFFNLFFLKLAPLFSASSTGRREIHWYRYVLKALLGKHPFGLLALNHSDDLAI